MIYNNSSIEAYLQGLLTIIDEAVCIVDKNEVVLYWNEAAEKTYNIKQQQIIGKKIDDFFHRDDLMVLKILKTEKSIRNAYHRPTSDKHVLINSSPIYNSNHELIGSISMERDITHTIKLNEQLSSTSTELHLLKKQMNRNSFYKIIGTSSILKKTIHSASKAAKTDATILVLGESGVGKELFVQAIHEASSRKNKPFVPINCGAIPQALFESELFGYERGAYTGASNNGKPGKMELADGGTLFLDEVGELPLDLQVKLLRALQEKEIYRIGGTTPKKIDVRVIAATNRNLEDMVAEGTFRSDLYYRLNVFTLHIPPLRERINDIPELVHHFLSELSEKYEKPIPAIEHNAINALSEYDWPGNIRELQNVIERVFILNETGLIREEDIIQILPSDVKYLNSMTNINSESMNDHAQNLFAERKSLEKNRIIETLKNTHGNKSAAAKKLGISRTTLYNKMKEYNIMM